MLSELKTFLAVARVGTLTGAGSRLGLTQSAVSAQMKRLEVRIGQTLFVRTGRSASLNDAGRALVPLAEQMLGLESQLLRSGRLESALALRIGAVTTAQKGVLARALRRFAALRSDVRLRIVPGVSLALLASIDADDIDLAIMIRPPFAIAPELIWQPLRREPYVLVVPGPLAATVDAANWRDLLQQSPFIRYDRASFGGRQVEQFLRNTGIAVHDAIELDDPEAALSLVAQGLGVALLPAIEAIDELAAKADQIKVISLGEAGFHRELGVLRRATSRSRAELDQLVDCLLAAESRHDG